MIGRVRLLTRESGDIIMITIFWLSLHNRHTNIWIRCKQRNLIYYLIALTLQSSVVRRILTTHWIRQIIF